MHLKISQKSKNFLSQLLKSRISYCLKHLDNTEIQKDKPRSKYMKNHTHVC